MRSFKKNREEIEDNFYVKKMFKRFKNFYYFLVSFHISPI